MAETIDPGITMKLEGVGGIQKKSEETKEIFPMKILQLLPGVDSPFPGMKGWLHQGEKTQVVFWQAEEGCICEEHRHPYDEWGVVLSGYTEETVEGKKKIYYAGDCFSIPANAQHSAKMSKGYRAIDIFASPSHVKRR